MADGGLREANLADIETQLKTIAINSGNNTTPKLVTRDLVPLENLTSVQLPALMIAGGAQSIQQEFEFDQDQNDLVARIIGIVEARTNRSQTLNKLMEDVKTKLMTDLSRNGNATTTKLISIPEVDEVSLAADDRAVFEMRFSIIYASAMDGL